MLADVLSLKFSGYFFFNSEQDDSDGNFPRCMKFENSVKIIFCSNSDHLFFLGVSSGYILQAFAWAIILVIQPLTVFKERLCNFSLFFDKKICISFKDGDCPDEILSLKAEKTISFSSSFQDLRFVIKQSVNETSISKSF